MIGSAARGDPAARLDGWARQIGSLVEFVERHPVARSDDGGRVRWTGIPKRTLNGQAIAPVQPWQCISPTGGSENRKQPQRDCPAPACSRYALSGHRIGSGQCLSDQVRATRRTSVRGTASTAMHSPCWLFVAIARSPRERQGSHTPDRRASVDSRLMVELSKGFQLHSGSGVVVQPLVSALWSRSIGGPEDFLMVGWRKILQNDR